MSTSETNRAIDAVWRIESAKVIAAVARIVRDVGLAEELAHDALVAALEQWPESGVPRNPGAWLMAIARRRAVDHMRRDRRFGRKAEEIAREIEARREPDGPDPTSPSTARSATICYAWSSRRVTRSCRPRSASR